MRTDSTPVERESKGPFAGFRSNTIRWLVTTGSAASSLDEPPPRTKDRENFATAASQALGNSSGLLHTHLPTDRITAGGCLGDFLRMWQRWTMYRASEPERTGLLSKCVDGRLSHFFAAVILANAVTMAFVVNEEMRNPKGQLDATYQNLELLFIVLYLIEQVLMLTVHRLHHLIGPSFGWNLFDILLVATSIMTLAPNSAGGGSNLTPLRSLRMMKVAKVLRLLRIFRFFAPLRHMLTALLASFIPLVWSLLMLAFLMYMFALYFVQACSDRLSDDDVLPGSLLWEDLQVLFGSIQSSMFTLFWCFMGGGDWLEAWHSIEQISSSAQMVFIFYVAFFHIAVLNIVTGMFVQSAMKLSQPDMDEQALDKLREHVSHLEELRSIAETIDENNDGDLSPHELMKFVRNPSTRAKLAVLDVDARDAETFVSLLSATSHNATISVNDFVNGCCRLKGNASSIDLQCQAFRMGLLQQSLQQLMTKQEALVKRLDRISQFEKTNDNIDGAVARTRAGSDAERWRSIGAPASPLPAVDEIESLSESPGPGRPSFHPIEVELELPRKL